MNSFEEINGDGIDSGVPPSGLEHRPCLTVGVITFPNFLASFPTPSIFISKSKIFPEIIIDLISEVIFPFFNKLQGL